MTEPPRVLVVVPHHNGSEVLELLLPSLMAQTYGDFHTVLVDDASTDGSPAAVASRWPEVEIIGCSQNRGFAATVNIGVERARGDYVALLNTDVVLEPDWLEKLVRTLDDHPEAASATGKTFAYPMSGVLDGAGNQMRWSGAATRRGFGTRDEGQFDRPDEVISACAGYALYRLSAWRAIGGFDEELVAYYEDVDWGLRAQLAGWSCRYEPTAVAYHVGGASHGSRPEVKVLERRNQLLVVLMDYPLADLIVRFPQIVVGQLILLVRASRRRGEFARQLEAIRAAVRFAPRVWRKRSSRTITPSGRRRLARAMSPERYAASLFSRRQGRVRGA